MFVEPATAGWRYLSFRTAASAASSRIELGGPDHETAIVLLFAGGRRRREAGEPAAWRVGRPSFHALPSALYLPPGRRATVTGASRWTDGPTDRRDREAPRVRGVGRAGVVHIRPEDIRSRSAAPGS